METDVENYKCLKALLKNVVNINDNNKNVDIITRIDNASKMTSKIITVAFQFIKSYIIYLYENNDEIPNINIDFIDKCIKVISTGDGRGPPIKNNTGLLKKLTAFYDNQFKHYSIYKKSELKRKKMNCILAYSKIQMMTAYKNLITTSFTKKLNHYVNCVFRIKNQYKYDNCTSKAEIKELKYTLRREVGQIKRDLLMGSLRSDIQYHEWIKTNRNILLPSNIKENVYYDVVCNPQKYVKHLIFINKELERLKCRQINVFPLKRSLVPSYITLDTASLLELLYDSGTKDLRDNLCDHKKLIWSSWFRLNNSCFHMSKSSKYKFDYTILSDGIGISVRFSTDHNIHKKSKKNTKKCTIKTNKRTTDDDEKNKREFKYITELSSEELNDLRNNNRVYVDPNLSNIIYAIDESNDKIFRYTRAQRRCQTGRNKHKHIVNAIKKHKNLNPLEAEISLKNSKSCNHDNFKDYVKEKNSKIELANAYEDELFRKLKIREKINTQRSESKLLNNYIFI